MIDTMTAPTTAAALAILTPNPWNRKRFDQAKLEELAASIRKVGVLQPLVVRPDPSTEGFFQIVAGERRFRASGMAELTEVPIAVRDLSDVEVVEVMAIENAQREDVHPLEEATHYRFLLDHGDAYTVETIAAKVGKSNSYVYQRLKLADLTPKVRKAFEGDEITAGHAILIARLQPKDQDEALYECGASVQDDMQLSVRGLRDWIQQEVELDLSKASFPTDDPDLVKGAGTCAACPKRTGNALELFPEHANERDLCTDRACFAKKGAAFLQRRIAELKAGGEPFLLIRDQNDHRDRDRATIKNALDHRNWISCKQGEEGAQRALWVSGPRRGMLTWAKKGDRYRVEYSRPTRPTPTEAAKEKKWLDAHKTKERKAIRRRIWDATMERIATADFTQGTRLLRVVVERTFGRLWSEYQRQLCQLHEWERKKRKRSWGSQWEAWEELGLRMVKDLPDDALPGFLVEIALINDLEREMGERDALRAAAVDADVDIAAITKDVKAEYSAERKDRKARQAKKKRATKKKTAKRTKTKTAAKKKATTKQTAKKTAPPRRTKKKTATKKSSTAKKRTPARPSFMEPLQPDEALAAIVGSKPQPRTEITKNLWAYIKRNGLQDKKNQRMINADEKLLLVFGGKKQVSMFEMTKLVGKHLLTKANGRRSAKKKATKKTAATRRTRTTATP